MAKDYVRICTSCGHTWQLPKAWAKEKAPRSLQLSMANRAARGAVSRRQKTAYGINAATLNEAQERVIRNGTCAACGTYNAYDQSKAG